MLALEDGDCIQLVMSVTCHQEWPENVTDC